MAFDAFYYVFENDFSIGARIKGNPIVQQDNGTFKHGSFFADDFIITTGGNIVINDFNSSQGDQLVFSTGYGILTTDQLMSYITDTHYTENDFVVQFGDAATLTLIGVHPGGISLDDVVVLS